MNPFAIYFPQFYPTPTNDAAWGKGFTDWALVANANMRHQWNPRAPLRGYYDGASSHLHHEQMDEARRAGLAGFAVYHYWFFTHQELGAFEKTLITDLQRPTFPWFLIWASEGWSRRWMGDPTQIVHLSPEPRLDDIQRHCDYLASCFSQPCYLRIAERPLFAWYNLGHFHRPEEVVATYRVEWQKRGFDPHTAQFVKKVFDVDYSPLVDTSYLFEPRLYFSMRSGAAGSKSKRVRDLVARMFGERFVTGLMVFLDRAASGQAYAAEDFLQYLRSPQRLALASRIRGNVQDVVSPGWNNAPRYGDRATAVGDLAPLEFGRLVSEAALRPGPPPLINAWNEWSEGAAVEPCAYLGSRYLEAMQAEIAAVASQRKVTVAA